MDWLAKMIGLPHEFLHSNKETMGGGVIQVTCVPVRCLCSTFVQVITRFVHQTTGQWPKKLDKRLMATETNHIETARFVKNESCKFLKSTSLLKHSDTKVNFIVIAQ
jgi:hypothetical protein